MIRNTRPSRCPKCHTSVRKPECHECGTVFCDACAEKYDVSCRCTYTAKKFEAASGGKL